MRAYDRLNLGKIAANSPIWHRMRKRANAGDLNEQERVKSGVEG